MKSDMVVMLFQAKGIFIDHIFRYRNVFLERNTLPIEIARNLYNGLPYRSHTLRFPEYSSLTNNAA
jgi:hypothetical protein